MLKTIQQLTERLKNTQGHWFCRSIATSTRNKYIVYQLSNENSSGCTITITKGLYNILQQECLYKPVVLYPIHIHQKQGQEEVPEETGN